jgi:hypothetical protein
MESPINLKDWVFIIGVVVILLVAAGDLLAHPSSGRKERSPGIRAGYSFAILNLLCAVNFLEWRRGLVQIGVLGIWSWGIGTIGIIMVIALSIVSWRASYGDHDRNGWWTWASALALYMAAVAGYITVASK